MYQRAPGGQAVHIGEQHEVERQPRQAVAAQQAFLQLPHPKPVVDAQPVAGHQQGRSQTHRGQQQHGDVLHAVEMNPLRQGFAPQGRRDGGYQMLVAEEAVVDEAEDHGADADAAEDAAGSAEPPAQGHAPQQQHQTLPQIAEHHAEEQHVGDADEPGGVHLIVAGGSVGGDQEFEGPHQPVVPKPGGTAVHRLHLGIVAEAEEHPVPVGPHGRLQLRPLPQGHPAGHRDHALHGEQGLLHPQLLIAIADHIPKALPEPVQLNLQGFQLMVQLGQPGLHPGQGRSGHIQELRPDHVFFKVTGPEDLGVLGLQSLGVCDEVDFAPFPGAHMHHRRRDVLVVQRQLLPVLLGNGSDAVGKVLQLRKGQKADAHLADQRKHLMPLQDLLLLFKGFRAAEQYGETVMHHLNVVLHIPHIVSGIEMLLVNIPGDSQTVHHLLQLQLDLPILPLAAEAADPVSRIHGAHGEILKGRGDIALPNLLNRLKALCQNDIPEDVVHILQMTGQIHHFHAFNCHEAPPGPLKAGYLRPLAADGHRRPQIRRLLVLVCFRLQQNTVWFNGTPIICCGTGLGITSAFICGICG